MVVSLERCMLEDWVDTPYWEKWRFGLFFLTILNWIYVVLENMSGWTQSWLLDEFLEVCFVPVLVNCQDC